MFCHDEYLLQKFFRYYDHVYSKKLRNSRRRANFARSVPYGNIFLKCSSQCFNVFFIYFVTLAVFPTVFSEVKMTDQTFIIPPKYFTAVTCFLTFNLFAVIGNLIPSNSFAMPPKKWVFIPVILRFLFIPFFVLCNYQPSGAERLWPVLIPWDYVYWIGGALLGMSGGYLSSLSMMYCPRCVEPETLISGWDVWSSFDSIWRLCWDRFLLFDANPGYSSFSELPET